MRATRGLMLSALCGWILTASPAVLHAQIYDASRRSLDFAPDPTARSPRLLGMGRLSLLSDIHNRIDLWDMAANPIGVFQSDTASTFDVWPGTSSADGRHTVLEDGLERGHLAGRELRVGFEAIRRGDNAGYGLYGDAAGLRADRPFNDTRVLRDRADNPRVFGVLNGRMPYFQSKRMLYELHTFYMSENDLEQYRRFFTNASGQYLGKESELLGPPNFFDPDEYRVSTLGGGLGISYRVATWLNAALGGEASSSRIEGENSDRIHDTGTGEDRSYYTLRGGLTGTWAGAIEYAADGRTWTAGSEERYVFTLKAGQNQSPFTGRGKMLDRTEDGREGTARVRWNLGSLELNGGAKIWKREVLIQPTAPGAPGSYNLFLDVAANRLGADSLALPDSIRRSASAEKGLEFAYGAAWRMATRGLLGFEYHFAKLENEQLVFLNPLRRGPDPDLPDFWPEDTLSYLGDGPDRRTWDVRGGFEYACTPALKGRLGYIHRSDDRDERTANNEFTSETLTLGFGIQPVGSTWALDLGWAMEWISPDFTDATNPRESRQQVAAQIHWVF